jgi:hypothetical protein
MSKVNARLIRLGAVVAVSTCGLLVADGAAGAAGPTGSANSGALPASLSGIKAAAATAITKRVNDLNAAVVKANEAHGLGSGQATLDSYLGADIGPLQALNTKIQGDTTVQQARQNFATIYTAYRVYLLVLPAARLAGDSDRTTSTVLPKLTSDSSKARARENSSNEAQLAPLISDLNAQIGAATTATNGLASTVLDYTPGEWNGNHELLWPAKSSEQAADAAVKQGHQDVVQMVEILRPGLAGGVQAHASSTTTTS